MVSYCLLMLFTFTDRLETELLGGDFVGGLMETSTGMLSGGLAVVAGCLVGMEASTLGPF